MNEITVCIPTIPPRAGLLTRALASVLIQSKPASAISVAVDINREGAGKTRNRALFAARTEWVAFLDDDDEMKSFHLQRLLEVALKTGADVVYPWFDTMPFGCDPFPGHNFVEYDPAHPHLFPITTLVRRELAFAVGGFPDNDGDPLNGGVGAGEDWVFWLRLRDAGAKVAHTEDHTWVWHHDSNNTGGLPTRW